LEKTAVPWYFESEPNHTKLRNIQPRVKRRWQQTKQSTNTPRIQESVSTYIFSGMDAMPTGKTTISIGISAYPELAITLEEVIEQADRALYQVKSQGKNQSLVYTRDPRARQDS